MRESLATRSGSRSRARDMRALDHTLRELRTEHDQLRAHLTLPVRPRPLCHALTPGRGMPAVEPHVWDLHIRYYHRRDTASRAELVEIYSAHARALASRFYRQREPMDDLVQVAMEALLVALDRFEPSRRMPFLGFANPTIIGCLKRYYRDAGWAMRVPRRAHELSRPVREASDLLQQDLGRPPTPPEIADLLDVDPDSVTEAIQACTARSTTSLDAPSREETQPLSETIGASDPGMRRVENLEALRRVLELLPDDDRKLLELYFGRELTQSQIARRIGVSQMQVSRSLTRVLKRLRSHLPDEV